MATLEFNLLCAIEGHSVDEIRQILDEGFDVRTLIKGKSVVAHLTEMYSRSDQFPDCLRLLLDRGAHWTTRESVRFCSTTPTACQRHCAPIHR